LRTGQNIQQIFIDHFSLRSHTGNHCPFPRCRNLKQHQEHPIILTTGFHPQSRSPPSGMDCFPETWYSLLSSQLRWTG